MKLLLGGLAIVITALFGVAYSGSSAHADETCDAIRVIFARGSGENINHPTEQRFKQQLEARLSTSAISWSLYELGSSTYGGHQYKAIPVDPFENPDNLTGAILSGGMANDYGKSVEEGINELRVYLNKLHTDCPTTKIVLGGYSQGAQVMGQSLEQLSLEIRKKIAFVALFGDPKLELPEGSGVVPPACQGKDFSPWRRVIGNCRIHDGSLGGREPYLPVDMEQKTGLWCVGGDPVCGSLENIHIPSHHDQYRITDGPIDQAAYEIAVRLDAEGVAANLLPDLDDLSILPPTVIFMVDGETAISREGHFRAIEQPLMEAVARKVDSIGGHLGVLIYGPTCGDRLEEMPGQALNLFVNFRDNFDAPPGCSLETYSPTLDKSMETSKWWFDMAPENAQKIFVVFSDNPYSKMVTLASFSKINQIEDNFYIYPLVPEDVRTSYESLKIDGGKTIVLDDYDVDKIINDHSLHPQAKPQFDSPDYKALPGQIINFSAEKSIVYDDEIVEYLWDFGDGSSFVSNEPIAEHTYAAVFEGQAALTVTTKNGLQKSTTANVTVQEEVFGPVLDAPKNLRAHATGQSNVRLTWAQNKQADRWLITLDGIPLGYTDKSTVSITDVERQRDNTFAVYGVTAEGDVGEKSEVVLPAGSTDGGIGSVGNTLRDGSTTRNATLAAAINSPNLFLPAPSVTYRPAQSDILGSVATPTSHTNATSVNYVNILLGILATSAVLISGWVIVRKMVHKEK